MTQIGVCLYLQIARTRTVKLEAMTLSEVSAECAYSLDLRYFYTHQTMTRIS